MHRHVRIFALIVLAFGLTLPTTAAYAQDPQPPPPVTCRFLDIFCHLGQLINAGSSNTTNTSNPTPTALPISNYIQPVIAPATPTVVGLYQQIATEEVYYQIHPTNFAVDAANSIRSTMGTNDMLWAVSFDFQHGEIVFSTTTASDYLTNAQNQPATDGLSTTLNQQICYSSRSTALPAGCNVSWDRLSDYQWVYDNSQTGSGWILSPIPDARIRLNDVFTPGTVFASQVYFATTNLNNTHNQAGRYTCGTIYDDQNDSVILYLCNDNLGTNTQAQATSIVPTYESVVIPATLAPTITPTFTPAPAVIVISVPDINYCSSTIDCTWNNDTHVIFYTNYYKVNGAAGWFAGDVRTFNQTGTYTPYIGTWQKNGSCIAVNIPNLPTYQRSDGSWTSTFYGCLL